MTRRALPEPARDARARRRPTRPRPGAGDALTDPAPDPIGSKLFPPELIMTHQAELGLEDRQRETILKELEKAQSQFPGSSGSSRPRPSSS